MQQRRSKSRSANKKGYRRYWLIGSMCLLLIVAGAIAWEGGFQELVQRFSVTYPPSSPSGNTHEKPHLSSATSESQTSEVQEKRNEEATTKAKQQLAQMSLDEKVGQLLFVDMSAVEVENPTSTMKQSLENMKPGGVILFRSNAETIQTTIEQTSMLRELGLKIPAWIGVDQEGGVVSRFPFMSRMNGNMAIAATGNPDYARETATRIGHNLHALGMNLNFAPVADVNSNPSNPVIGIRSFGSSADVVSQYVLPMIEGMHQASIPAVIKHFPGHGDTNVDSHINLPVLDHSKEQMEMMDLKPFQDAIEAGVDMVMSAHVAVPSLDDSTIISKKDGEPVYKPASLSKELITHRLRTEMHFQGVVVTDAMNMGAIEQHFGIEEASEMAIDAGVDILLMPAHPSRVKEHLVDAVLKGRLSHERIDESVLRILTVKAKYGLLDKNEEQATKEEQIKHAEEWMKNNGDLEFALQVARQAITMKGDSSHLPFISSRMKRLHIVGTDPYAIKLVNEAIQSSLSDHSSLTTETISFKALSQNQVRNNLHLSEMNSDEDGILFVTRDLQLKRQNEDVMKRAILYVATSDIPMASVSIGSPYDVKSLEQVPLSFISYGATTANIQAVAEALFASEPPPGHSPVDLNISQAP